MPHSCPADDFAGVVLEALELRELAFVHHDVVAHQPHIGAALDGAVGDAAAGDVADLRHLEDLEDHRVAEHGLADRWREQAGHRLLHVVDEVVDDVVVADLDAGALGGLARFLVGAHVEADDRRIRRFGQPHVRLGDAADAGMQHARRHLVGAELVERAGDGFDRALHVGLDDQREILAARGLDLRHHLLERAAHAARPRRGLLALLAGAIGGDLAGAGLRCRPPRAGRRHRACRKIPAPRPESRGRPS